MWEGEGSSAHSSCTLSAPRHPLLTCATPRGGGRSSAPHPRPAPPTILAQAPCACEGTSIRFHPDPHPVSFCGCRTRLKAVSPPEPVSCHLETTEGMALCLRQHQSHPRTLDPLQAPCRHLSVPGRADVQTPEQPLHPKAELQGPQQHERQYRMLATVITTATLGCHHGELSALVLGAPVLRVLALDTLLLLLTLCPSCR